MNIGDSVIITKSLYDGHKAGTIGTITDKVNVCCGAGYSVLANGIEIYYPRSVSEYLLKR